MYAHTDIHTDVKCFLQHSSHKFVIKDMIYFLPTLYSRKERQQSLFIHIYIIGSSLDKNMILMYFIHCSLLNHYFCPFVFIHIILNYRVYIGLQIYPTSKSKYCIVQSFFDKTVQIFIVSLHCIE